MSHDSGDRIHCDIASNDPRRFDERLGKLVKHKPMPEKGK